MAASISTFRPHLVRVIRDLFRQLHALCYGTEALRYSNHPSEAAVSQVSGHNLRVPWFLRSTVVPMHLPHQCRHYVSAVSLTVQTLVLALVVLNNRQ